MMRDFFAYLLSLTVGGWVAMPGGEIIMLGADWVSRTQTAYRNAVSACENERNNYQWLAGEDWQKIFGAKIPEGIL